MLATLINAAAIVCCGIIGNVLRKGFPEALGKLIVDIFALSVLVIGARMALKGENDIIVVLSLVIGAGIGYLLKLDKHLESFGVRVKKLAHVNDNMFVEGFVSASLIFCVGAMAIVGSLEAGLNHNGSILLTKSVLDGTMAIVLASSSGIGVAFSALSVFIYQGAITLLAGVLEPVLTDTVVGYMTAVGGVLIMAIGVSMSGRWNINTANLLPALLIAAVMGYLMPFLGM